MRGAVWGATLVLFYDAPRLNSCTLGIEREDGQRKSCRVNWSSSSHSSSCEGLPGSSSSEFPPVVHSTRLPLLHSIARDGGFARLLPRRRVRRGATPRQRQQHPHQWFSRPRRRPDSAQPTLPGNADHRVRGIHLVDVHVIRDGRLWLGCVCACARQPPPRAPFHLNATQTEAVRACAHTSSRRAHNMTHRTLLSWTTYTRTAFPLSLSLSRSFSPSILASTPG